MMKITYCIHSIFNSGGMERIVVNKVNYLASQGHSLTIITTEQNRKKTFFSLDSTVNLIDLDINYSEDNDKNILFKSIRYLRKKRKHKRLLAESLQSIHSDITISTFGNEASFLPSIKDGSKKILEIHFSKFFRMQYGRKGLWKLVDIYRSWKDERTVTYYDKFVVLTNEDKDLWGKVPNITVIPNFVNIPPKSSDLQNKVCIAVGRLSYQKNFECLLDIWNLVCDKFPDWCLHIYGAGENRDYLMQKMKDLNLSTVSICNPTSQIYDAYVKSSIFLLTSRYEGLPMVLLEAMSAGLPSIAFSCKCGPCDLISNGMNGFLIQEGDLNDFSTKLMLLMENSELRIEMGKKAKIEMEKYTRESVMKKWSDLFMSLK